MKRKNQTQQSLERNLCSICHKFPIYERKAEGKWEYPFSHTDNPFDSGSNFESVPKRKYHDRLKKYREIDEDDR